MTDIHLPNAGLQFAQVLPAKQFSFEPQADITTLELAHCLQLLLIMLHGPEPTCEFDGFLDLHGIRRHFLEVA